MSQQYGYDQGQGQQQPQGGYPIQQYPPQGVPAGPQPIQAQPADQLVLLGQNMAAVPMFNAIVANRPAFAHIEVNLQPGQKILAGAKAMNWMDARIPISTNMNGCCDAWVRTWSRESCCQNTFTGPGNIAFAMDIPGDILPFGVTAEASWVVSPGAFIAGTDNLKITSRFAGCAACCCGDEGPFLTKISVESGNGMFYAGGYGAITRHEIPEGKTLFIDQGLFFAANGGINLQLGLPGGCISCCFGGEGLVMKVRGPTVVYTQNRNPHVWQKILNPPPPKKKGRNIGGGPSM